MGKRKESYERIAWIKYENGIFESGIVKNKSPEKCDVIKLIIRYDDSPQKYDGFKLIMRHDDGKEVEVQGHIEEHFFSIDEAVGVVTVMQDAICKYVYRHADELRALEGAKG